MVARQSGDATLMHAISTASLESAQQGLRHYAESTDAGTLSRVADEIFGVGSMIDANPILRRLLTDSSTGAGDRTQLLRRLLGDKVGEDTLGLLDQVVRGRWGDPVDFSDALEQVGRAALLAAADREGSLDEVEDELFRFGRVLAREPSLQLLLSDRSVAAERRLELLDSLIGRRVRWPTRALIEHALAARRGRGLERAVDEITEQAAVRRNRVVGYVRSAVALAAEQQHRLAAALTRVYGREVELRTEVDPTLVGGLLIKVGDEVIDGSVLHRLDAARRALT